MSAGIKNWHWRSKDVAAWAKQWFEDHLTGITTDSVHIIEVLDVQGDCEVGMRKSKLVTIYDEKITMKWQAKDPSSDTLLTGTLTALEVSHDMDLDEYQFTSTLDTSNLDTPELRKEGERCHSIAKKALANLCRDVFQLLPKDLIDTHGKHLLVDDSSSSSTPSASGSSTPLKIATLPVLAAAAPVAAVVVSKKGLDGLSFNTSSVKVEAEFQISAEDLFDFLTNASKIPSWTRNTATFDPVVGGKVSLFGGNIVGEVTSISRPTEVVQSWRAPTWAEGHFGTLTTTLSQSSNSTTLTLRLAGVPVGQEEESERNLNGYYINGLRSIGFVIPDRATPATPSPFSASPSSSSSLRSRPSASSSTAAAPERAAPAAAAQQQVPPQPSLISLILTTAIPMSISLGLIGGLMAAFWYGPSGPGRSS